MTKPSDKLVREITKVIRKGVCEPSGYRDRAWRMAYSIGRSIIEIDHDSDSVYPIVMNMLTLLKEVQDRGLHAGSIPVFAKDIAEIYKEWPTREVMES